jgi:hypothetical protein
VGDLTELGLLFLKKEKGIEEDGSKYCMLRSLFQDDTCYSYSLFVKKKEKKKDSKHCNRNL